MTYCPRIANRGLKVAMLAGASLFAQQASAQDDTQGETARGSVLTGNVIVVTAQKKEENLQDVGIAVTAFSSEQIDKLGFESTTDIVFQTPGLQIYEFSPSLTVYNLRGVSQNSFSDNLEGPVAVYIDDAYISALGAQNQPIYDLERVEVLKGPQGTLYGRNATGGLIHYISKRPTDYFEGRVSATYGSYNFREIEAAISGPLTDGVRARIAAIDIKEDGYLKSTNPNVRDAYGKNSTSVKAFLEADVGSGKLTINPFWSKDSNVPTGAYTRREGVPDPATGLGTAQPYPDDVYQFSADTQGRFDREIFGITGKLELPLNDAIDFVSVTNYQNMDKYYLEDADSTADTIGDIFGNPPFGPGSEAFAPLGVFAFSTDQDFEQFSQEIRISGDGANYNWQAGAFYLNIKESNNATIEGLAALWFNPDTGGLTQLAINDADLDVESWSVFAQGELWLTDRLKLIVGGRFVRDVKNLDSFIRYEEAGGIVLARGDDAEVQSIYGAGVDGGLIAPICYGTAVDSRCAGDVADPAGRYAHSDWAGKLQLDFEVSDDVLVYAGVNRGTKGGNWATPSFADSVRLNGLDVLSHTEETLWSYEAGLKATIFGGAGRFNAAVFHYDYKDYQAFSLINFVQNITNNDAKVTGGEIEFAVNPTAGLDIMLGASFLDTKVQDIVVPFGPPLDRELPNAPSVSLNGLIRYAFPIGDNGEFSLQVDGNYNGSQYLEVTNADSDLEPSYFVGNFRATYEPNDALALSFWVKNFTDSKYRLFALDVSGAPQPFLQDVFAKPRTYGGTVSFDF